MYEKTMNHYFKRNVSYLIRNTFIMLAALLVITLMLTISKLGFKLESAIYFSATISVLYFIVSWITICFIHSGNQKLVGKIKPFEYVVIAKEKRKNHYYVKWDGGDIDVEFLVYKDITENDTLLIFQNRDKNFKRYTKYLKLKNME